MAFQAFSLTEFICWKWCQKSLQNQFKVIYCPEIKSLLHLTLNYETTENISKVLFRVENICVIESPSDVDYVYSLTQSSFLLTCKLYLLSATKLTETSEVLWKQSRTAFKGKLWRKKNYLNDNLSEWKTAISYFAPGKEWKLGNDYNDRTQTDTHVSTHIHTHTDTDKQLQWLFLVSSEAVSRACWSNSYSTRSDWSHHTHTVKRPAFCNFYI